LTTDKVIFAFDEHLIKKDPGNFGAWPWSKFMS